MYVIIVGCGRVGSELATLLSSEGHDVVVIDINPKSFRRLGAGFNGLTIVGNGFDEDILKEAGIDKADAFAALTDLDNTNMMTAQVAKRIFKVPRVVARLYNPDREATYQRLGLEIVCGTTLVANYIRNKILQSHFFSHLALGRGEVEIIEFKANETLDGKKISEVEVAGAFLVTCLIRDSLVTIPAKDDILKEDDVLVGVVKTSAVKKVKELLKIEE